MAQPDNNSSFSTIPKVLILTTSYPLTSKSMSGIFVKRLTDEFVELCDITVLCPDDETSNSQTINVVRCRYAPKSWQTLAHKHGGIPVALRSKPWLHLLVPGLLLSLFVQTLRILPKKQIVLANWSINALVAALPCWILGKKLVTVLRGEDVRIENSRIKRFILEIAIKASDKVVLVSKDMQVFLTARYPKWQAKFQVITNGVAQDLLNKNLASEKQANWGKLQILSVGSLIQRKGIDKIIRSISQPELVSKPLQLTIVGGGELEIELKELSKNLNLDSKIIFTGQLPPEKVYPYYHHNQVFILASSHEGRPNVLIEAMAAGCCVISSKINGTKELINHNENGLLFSLERTNELAVLILKLINNPDSITKLGRNARRTIIDQKLTWQGTANDYVTLFRRLL